MDKRLFMCLHERPEAVLRLICFPWAGGGALHFAQRWGERLAPFVEVVGIVLPGRESRQGEPLLHDFEDAYEKVFNAKFRSLLHQKPFAFFGHSMGAMYAFEATAHCKQFGLYPEHLFISACVPPMHQINMPKWKVSEWPRENLISYLRLLGGMPESILHDKKKLDILLPMLVADFNLIDSYRKPTSRFSNLPLLSCPITSFAAEQDSNSDHREDWQLITSGAFMNVTFEGDNHFYLLEEENEKKLIADITSQLQTTKSRL